MASTIALILAGGSTETVCRSLWRVGGRALVVRSIEHARSASGVDRVFVLADDDEIAVVAAAAGAEVIRGPADTAGLEVSIERAVTHALEELARDNVVPATVALLDCACPFRSPGQLDAAIEAFVASPCQSLVAGVALDGFVWRKRDDGPGCVLERYDRAQRPRRGEIQDGYLETGSFTVFDRAMFETTGSPLGGDVEVFEVPAADGLVVDDRSKLERARLEANLHGDPAILNADQYEWLVLDVDGTQTDAGIYFGENAIEVKRFDVRDGTGIQLWQAHGGKVAFITPEKSQAVAQRARQLGIRHAVLGALDKAEALDGLFDRHDIDASTVVAMGDDVGDLAIVERVGLFAAPADAHPEIRARAGLVTCARAGYGAVREVIDLLLRGRSSG